MAARCRQGAPCSFRDGLRLAAKKLPTGFDFCSLSGSSVLRELAGFRGSVQALFRPCLALLSWDAKLSWTIVRRGWPRLLKLLC
jgi:hypothetical protein